MYLFKSVFDNCNWKLQIERDWFKIAHSNFENFCKLNLNNFYILNIKVLNSMINQAEAINCWTLTGGSTALTIPSTTAAQFGASTTCAAGTCKVYI